MANTSYPTTANNAIFGSAAVIIKANGEEDAIRIANDTEYGLSSVLRTRSLEKGVALAKRIEAGMMHVIVGPKGGCRRSCSIAGRGGRGMIWTTEKPTQPGIYWHRAQGIEPTVVRLTEADFVEVLNYQRTTPLDEALAIWHKSEWAGPLEPPQQQLKPTQSLEAARPSMKSQIRECRSGGMIRVWLVKCVVLLVLSGLAYYLVIRVVLESIILHH
jgi:hypothetical protein